MTNLLDIAGIAGVAFFGTTIAARISGRSEVTFANMDFSVVESHLFLWVILTIVGLFLLKSVLATVLLRSNGLFLARVEVEASREIAEFLFGGNAERLKKYEVSRIQWSVTSSTAAAFSNLLTNFNVLVAESSLFALVFVAFAVADLQTALIVTLYFLILLIIFQVVINRRLMRAGALLASSSKRASESLFDLIRAFKELLVLSRITHFLDKFHEYRLLEARTFARVRFFDGSPRFFVESALMLGVLALVGWQFIRGNLEEGLTTTAIFMAGGVRMMGALLPLQNALSWMRVHGPQAEDAQNLLIQARSRARDVGMRSSRPSIEVGATSPDPETPSRGVSVRFDRVSFKYEEFGQFAVRDLSLDIERGQHVALVGPSGAGKTTTADLLLGVVAPLQGLVSIEGLSPAEFRNANAGAVAYVPQKPGMVTGSIAENIALGIEPAHIDSNRVKKLLSQVGLLVEIERQGLSIWSDIGAQADGLSGGQLQRLGLARALYTGPALLVLDEATSALDAGSEAEISRYIGDLKGSVTVVVIAHRLSTIKTADRVFVIEDGLLVGSGTFSEVRRKNPLIESYVKLMSFGD